MMLVWAAAATLPALASAHAAQSCPQLPPGAGVPPLSLTPLVVRPLQTVIEPVPATDGLVHLAYAAQATNMHQGRAEILSSTLAILGRLKGRGLALSGPAE